MVGTGWRRENSLAAFGSRVMGSSASLAMECEPLPQDLKLIEGRIGAETLSGIVKVHTTHCFPNYSLPWQKLRQYQTTSSGFVTDTDRRWILTNAHSVQHHTVVRVKRHGSDVKYTAVVLSEAYDCDLALLTVKDDAFWEGVEEIPFGPDPHLQQAVTVIGYPVGGENISVTTGVVKSLHLNN